ncbi:hypothetical protein ACODM8_12345 [Vibrio ostreicida]|uniref:Alpha/beta hydrolase n=1 Tax=Vibrio ostreicida TaxID=526588 RepID=A0ABT8C1X1_9VIBR|nr:hypothetical protein [Vibrio ostreicida]MDN3612355.1 hypothetical protein [Vibrio ostreicida]NPD09874.1 hypothetical protein [Vibrio ostreicida]
MMKVIAKMTSIALMFITSGATQAAIGDYKVVLIHGFQSDQLQSKPDKAQVEREGEDYWKDYWLQYSEARIDWPAYERVEGKISSEYAWPKLQELSRDRVCQPGCVFVTHSTGDLVARYILDNQANWLSSAGLTPLNIVATFDFAGAGGGSELSDILVNVFEGGGVLNEAMRYALALWLGEMPNKENAGVLNDLKVSNARQIARLSEHRIPRIRFVGNGTDYLKTTSVFLPGNDDGVVAAHSACGAADPGRYNSCSTRLAMNGKMVSQNRGVSSFMPEHYPFIMGNGYSHSDVVGEKHKGKVTSSMSQIALADGQSVEIQTYKAKSWWGTQYLYVQGSNRSTMSEIAVGLH